MDYQLGIAHVFPLESNTSIYILSCPPSADLPPLGKDNTNWLSAGGCTGRPVWFPGVSLI